MTAIELLTTGTIKAGFEILRSNGKDPRKADCALLSEVYKSTIKDNLDSILQEWREATEADISENWLKTILNTQCTEMATIALKKAELIN